MAILSTIRDKLLLAQRQLMHRLFIGRSKERDVIREFHKLYYYSSVAGKTWSDTWWQGIQVLKCPLDLWIYQEIIFRLKPDLIIETGTYKGGAAHFLASVLDLIGKGEIITIDIEEYSNRPVHPRITYLHGSSTDQKILQQIIPKVPSVTDVSSVLVILD